MNHGLAVESPSTKVELRRLAVLAWPVIVGQIGLMMMGVVDTIMVGHIDGDALAAIAIGNAWSFAFVAFGIGVASGLDPLITQAHGARKPNAFNTAVARGAVLLSLVSVFLMAGHTLAIPGLRFLGQPEQILPLAGAYCDIVLWSVPAMLLFSLVRQSLQAKGIMRPAMWVALIGNVVNVGANWVMMYGIGGVFEGIGPVGVAWSSLVVRWVMALSLTAVAPTILTAAFKHWRDAVSPSDVVAVAWVAVPVGLHMCLEVWAFEAAYMIAGWFGPTALAAHTVAANLSALSFMVPLGLSAAAATRVGNLAGAGGSWTHAGWTAIGTGAVLMLLSAVIYATFPDWLAWGFTPNDAEVWMLAATILPMVALFQVADGVQVMCFGVLRGLGDTRLPAAANVVGYWMVGLPVGAWLAITLNWGPVGIWAGLAVALTIVSLLLLIRVATLAKRRRQVPKPVAERGQGPA